MKFAKNKTIAIAIALILMFLMVASMIVIPARAATDQLPTYMIISVEPNPIGVGQTVYVNAFLSKPTATMGGSATANAGDRFANITVAIVHPDGTKETLGPYQGDPTGGIWFTYVPATAGNYTFQAFYPGQTLTYGTTYAGDYMLPSVSVIFTLVVQQTPIGGYSSPPLPTEYWSRPIYATNYAWAALGGNWFGLGASSFATTGMYDATGNFQPYTTAPNTGHIVWTKPTAFGGQVGAPYNADQESQYTSTSIVIKPLGANNH